MIHIVSFSFPPENVPAAHRPYYLAQFLENNGEKVAVHSAAGRSGLVRSNAGAGKDPATTRSGRFKKGLLIATSLCLGKFIQVDKALPWAVKSLPRLLFALIRDRLDTGERPIVWATAPLTSNIYLGGIASLLAGADLHLDIRDAIDGINDRQAPFMTRWVMGRTKTLTTVTPTLSRFIERSGFCPPAAVVFNGVSDESLSNGAKGVGKETGWVEIAYAGALYGGERPYVAAIELLSEAANSLPSELRGIRLSIAGREDLSMLRGSYDHARFQLRLMGQLDKAAALELASTTEINLILIGPSLSHRCGIPLKTFDLLGVGRPILYFGPGDADAVGFLQEFGAEKPYVVDSDLPPGDAAASLVAWLMRVRRSTSKPVSEPSADSQSRKISELLLEGR